MKQIFKDVQKQHMKQLKEEQKSPQAKPNEGRGFVGECLVKVVCEDGASVEGLKVRGVRVCARGLEMTGTYHPLCVCVCVCVCATWH